MKLNIFSVVIAALLITPSNYVASQESDAPAYDPAPFLSSMVALRTAAMTCDPFVGNSPSARTNSIPEFFKTLSQDLPDLVDTQSQSSLNRFVRSQAAVLCREKLDAAFLGYQAQATRYVEQKPADWPDPPAIEGAAWCASENCLEF